MMAEFNFLNSPEFGALGQVNQQVVNNERIAETTRIFGEIALQPLDAQIKREHANYYKSAAGQQEARAGLLKQQLANQQALAQRFSQMGSGGGQPAAGAPADPSEQLNAVGSRFLEAADLSIGLDPQNAARYAVAGASTVRAGAQASENAARTAGLRMTQNLQSLDRAAGVLQSDLPEDQKFDLIKLIIPPDTPDEQAWLDRLPRTKEGVAALGRMVMTARQRAQTDHEATRDARLAASAKIRDRANETLSRVREVQIKKIEEQTSAIRKAQGKPLRPLTAAERTDAASALKKTYPVFEDASYVRDLDVLSTAVAQDAQELVAKGVPRAAALQQALAGRAGDLEIYKVSGGLLSPDKQGVRVTTGGHTAAEALPVPAKPSDAKEGRYYRNAQGVVAIRRKDGWEPVQGGMSAAESALINAPDDTGDAGDDDEED